MEQYCKGFTMPTLPTSLPGMCGCHAQVGDQHALVPALCTHLNPPKGP